MSYTLYIFTWIETSYRWLFAASDFSGDTERLSYRAASTLLPRMHGSSGTSGHSDKSQKPLECASAYNPAL